MSNPKKIPQGMTSPVLRQPDKKDFQARHVHSSSGANTPNNDIGYRRVAQISVPMNFMMIVLFACYVGGTLFQDVTRQTEVKFVAFLEGENRYVEIMTNDRDIPAMEVSIQRDVRQYVQLREEVLTDPVEMTRRWGRGGILSKLQSEGENTVFQQAQPLQLIQAFAERKAYRIVKITGVTKINSQLYNVTWNGIDNNLSGVEIGRNAYQSKVAFKYVNRRRSTPEEAVLNPFNFEAQNYQRDSYRSTAGF
jgi:hypothetical protein